MTVAPDPLVSVVVVTGGRRPPGFLAELAPTRRYRLVGAVESVVAAVEVVRRRGADVVLVEVTSVQRLDELAELGRAVADTRVITVSELPSELALPAALAAGVRAFLEKPLQNGLLDQALSAVVAGHAYVDPRCTHLLVELALHGRNARSDPRMSLRQAQVLRLAGAGLTNRQIARIMGLSVETVKSHVGAAMRRLGVHGRLDAAALLERPGET